MTDPIEMLRKLAEAATPGPWSFGGCEQHPKEYNSSCWVVRAAGGSIVSHDRKNRAYEAAANPAVVLLLLDLVEASDKMREGSTTQTRRNYDTKRAALAKALEVTDG